MMLRAAVMLVLSGYIGMCMGEGVLPQGPLHGAVGGSVRFTTNLSPSEKPFSTVSWRFSNTSSAVSVNIITSTMSNNYTEHGYNNRISLDRATGGLELRDLRLEDSGEYTLTIIPEGQLILGKTTLKVYEPIKDVRVESWMNPPREGLPYMLTCNMTGFPEMIHWIKTRMEELSEIGGVFDMNNRTITFNPLKRNDTGDYKCMAANPLGNMTSLADKLHVNFGPDTPVFHGPAFVEEGRYSTFKCSAVSVPPGQFSWWFNGTEVADTSVFRTKPFTFNMSGEYTCMAHNRVTTKNSTKSKMVTVIEAIESVMIHNDTLPINSENFTLSCEVTGPYDAIYWTKDDTLLNMNASASDAHMNVHTVNNTLLFTPVTVDDDGTYQCFAVNKAARHGSQKHKLLVNYGPLSVSITGPDPVTSDSSSVSLTCSADSQPDCDFSWFFNNDTSAVSQSGSVITFSATKDNEGKYTCEARNPVTNITVYKSASYNGERTSRDEESVNVTVDSELCEPRCVNHAETSASPTLRAMIVLLELLYITLFSVVDTQEVAPLQVIGYLGHEVVLPCRVTGHTIVQIQWKLQQPEGQSVSIAVYNPNLGKNILDSPLKDRVEIEELSLIIKDVELNDAGLYMCRATTFPSGSLLQTVQLIVQEEMPLPSGIVFAIVAAVLLLLGIIAAGAYFIHMRRGDSSVGHRGLIDTGEKVTGVASPCDVEDVVYSHVNFKPSTKETPPNSDKDAATMSADVTYADVVVLNLQPK
ncbi:carcinoembryonic antigen-related cell adhesion molecule 5-like [Solea senegalensis]|uniref:Carcinoembryonic antigen-related cell adhesion molecule 5-like n=2 Tax=Solea senegalensis TaxID=28829 RepID=A0AAV6PUP9_SOLSE|nr:carcinoembryonic antigen-related cell adhesion molecule 5-like [Solea senegalensis]